MICIILSKGDRVITVMALRYYSTQLHTPHVRVENKVIKFQFIANFHYKRVSYTYHTYIPNIRSIFHIALVANSNFPHAFIYLFFFFVSIDINETNNCESGWKIQWREIENGRCIYTNANGLRVWGARDSVIS